MKKSKQKKCKRNSVEDLDQKQQDEGKYPKTKSIIEFDPSLACSIESLAVKKNSSIKPTTRFFSGKMLMLAKMSLDITYEFMETFFFPNKKLRKFTTST